MICTGTTIHLIIQLTTLNLEGQNREQQLRMQLVRELVNASHVLKLIVLSSD